MGPLPPESDRIADILDRQLRATWRSEQVQQGALPKLRLLDHLIGEQLQRVGHFEAKRLRSLQIDDQFEFGRLLDRQVFGLGTF